MNKQVQALKECLDACQEIEEIASRIYHLNADQFSQNDKISRLWRKTAIEEENHALQVGLLKKMVVTASGPSVDPSRSESVRNLIRLLYEAVRRTPSPPLEEAIRNAIVFEETLSRFHSENADLFDDREIVGLFKALALYDHEHLEVLESALALYSESEQ